MADLCWSALHPIMIGMIFGSDGPLAATWSPMSELQYSVNNDGMTECRVVIVLEEVVQGSCRID